MHHSMRCLVAFLLGATLTVGCTSSDTPQGETGSLSVDLVIADGIVINQVEWQITGNDMNMSSTIDVSAPGSTASVEVFGLPPGRRRLHRHPDRRVGGRAGKLQRFGGLQRRDRTDDRTDGGLELQAPPTTRCGPRQRRVQHLRRAHQGGGLASADFGRQRHRRIRTGGRPRRRSDHLLMDRQRRLLCGRERLGNHVHL